MKINEIFLGIETLRYLFHSKLTFHIKGFEQFIYPTKGNTFHKKLPPKKISRGCHMIERFSSIFGIKKCIIKTIAKRNFMKNYGFTSIVYIAVSKEDKFRSHSWVSAEGIKCYEAPNKRMKIIRIIES